MSGWRQVENRETPVSEADVGIRSLEGGQSSGWSIGIWRIITGLGSIRSAEEIRPLLRHADERESLIIGSTMTYQGCHILQLCHDSVNCSEADYGRDSAQGLVVLHLPPAI